MLAPVAHTWHRSCYPQLLELDLLLEQVEVQRIVVLAVVHSKGMVPADNTDSSCHIQHTVHILDIDAPLHPYLGQHNLDTAPVGAAAAAAASEALFLAWPDAPVAALVVGPDEQAVVVASMLQLADIQNIHMLPAFAVDSLLEVLLQSLSAGKS